MCTPQGYTSFTVIEVDAFESTDYSEKKKMFEKEK